MKSLVLFIIALYQVFFSVIVKQLLGIPASCRYSPTCSLYMQQQIRRYGVLKGGRMGLTRVLSCHPFARYAAV
jgi:uncharacterized protein